MGKGRVEIIDREAELQAIRDKLQQLLGGLSEEDAARLGNRLFAECRESGVAFANELVSRAWLMGAVAARNTLLGRRICRICGCWEEGACEPPCSWVAEDLCSACNVGGPR